MMPPGFRNEKEKLFKYSNHKELNRTETCLRSALCHVFKNESFMKPRYFPRNQDLTEINGFGLKMLSKVFYKDARLSLTPFQIQLPKGEKKKRAAYVNHSVRFFGRKIGDWTKLLSWKRGNLDFSGKIVPGLEFFVDGRSYHLNSIREDNKKIITWDFSESYYHEIQERPKFWDDDDTIGIVFEKEQGREAYNHLFNQITEENLNKE